MKLALAALLIFATVAPAVEAKPYRYRSSRSGYTYDEKCFRTEYSEQYIPGNSNRRGYVKTHRERVRIPCARPRFMPQTSPNHRYEREYPNVGRHDDNSCIEGSILGGIAGGGLGAALSRDAGRLWAIPLGIVGGAVAGCQVDGG